MRIEVFASTWTAKLLLIVQKREIVAQFCSDHGVLACRFGTISLYCAKCLCLINFSIFILLSRESDGCAMHRTNPDSFRSCICFRVFCSNVASEFFNLMLVRFHQARRGKYREASYSGTQQLGMGLTQNRVYLK